MIVCVAGNRDITDYPLVKRAIVASGFTVTKIVSGCARGVDNFGIKWAVENGVPIHRMPANWTKYGLAAGPIRNGEMAKYLKEHEAEFGGCGVIAVGNLIKPNGKDTGTGDMVLQSYHLDIQVFHQPLCGEGAFYHGADAR